MPIVDMKIFNGNVGAVKTITIKISIKMSSVKIVGVKIGWVENCRAAHATKSVRCWILPAARVTGRHTRPTLGNRSRRLCPCPRCLF